VRDLLERRLQTMVYKRGLSHSIKQARQFVVHGHIYVGGQKMNVPSFLVPLEAEHSLEFNPKSALADTEHPERQVKTKAKKKVKVKKDEEKLEGEKEKDEQS
jgi:small subunit ribosomal protein S4